MQTHLVINGVDYTPDIVAGSYNINTEDAYESWNDANMVEHRIVVSSKVVGSVQILCSEEGNWPRVADFLADIDAVTNNYVLYCGLYVPSRGRFEALNVYYKLENTSHIKSIGGKFTDIFTLTIKER